MLELYVCKRIKGRGRGTGGPVIQKDEGSCCKAERDEDESIGYGVLVADTE